MVLHIAITVLQAGNFITDHFIRDSYLVSGDCSFSKIRQLKLRFHAHFKMKSIFSRIIDIELANICF